MRVYNYNDTNDDERERETHDNPDNRVKRQVSLEIIAAKGHGIITDLRYIILYFQRGRSFPPSRAEEDSIRWAFERAEDSDFHLDNRPRTSV